MRLSPSEASIESVGMWGRMRTPVRLSPSLAGLAVQCHPNSSPHSTLELPDRPTMGRGLAQVISGRI
jgi:hypothetical protein